MTISKEQFTERYLRALEVNGDTLGTPDALKPYMQPQLAERFYALTEEMSADSKRYEATGTCARIDPKG